MAQYVCDSLTPAISQDKNPMSEIQFQHDTGICIHIKLKLVSHELKKIVKWKVPNENWSPGAWIEIGGMRPSIIQLQYLMYYTNGPWTVMALF